MVDVAKPPAAEPADRDWIVAEVSTNWPKPWPVHPRDYLCGKFEEIVNHNAARGYRLHSFQVHQLLTEPGAMVETIVAVFERVAGPAVAQPAVAQEGRAA